MYLWLSIFVLLSIFKILILIHTTWIEICIYSMTSFSLSLRLLPFLLISLILGGCYLNNFLSFYLCTYIKHHKWRKTNILFFSLIDFFVQPNFLSDQLIFNWLVPTAGIGSFQHPWGHRTTYAIIATVCWTLIA